MAEYVVPNEQNDDPSPGRTIHLEELRRAEPGWARPAWARENVVRREDDVEDEEMRAAREWLAHLQAGRIGPSAETKTNDGEAHAST